MKNEINKIPCDKIYHTHCPRDKSGAEEFIKATLSPYVTRAPRFTLLGGDTREFDGRARIRWNIARTFIERALASFTRGTIVCKLRA